MSLLLPLGWDLCHPFPLDPGWDYTPSFPVSPACRPKITGNSQFPPAFEPVPHCIIVPMFSWFCVSGEPDCTFLASPTSPTMSLKRNDACLLTWHFKVCLSANNIDLWAYVVPWEHFECQLHRYAWCCITYHTPCGCGLPVTQRWLLSFIDEDHKCKTY